MPREIVGTARIRTLASVVLLDLNAAPYTLGDWSDDEETADRTAVESPWVDGDGETNWRLVSGVIEVQVRIATTSWALTETARKALSDAVKAAPVWLLEREIEGVSHVWRANRPLSITSPITSADIANRRRTVVLRIPVQPTPAITGLEP